MSLYEVSHIIVLNSSDAVKLNGTKNSDVYFELNGLLKQDTKIVMSHVQLVSTQLPRSWYDLSSHNSKLSYTIASIIYSITIPTGNYNALNLISTMKSLFTLNGHTITPTISRINGKLTFTGTTNFTFNSVNSTILKILGFLPTINSASVANVLVASFPLNLLGLKRVILTSQKLATTAYFTSNNKIQIQSILGTIDVSVPHFGMITNPNTTNVKHNLNVKEVNGIDLQFRDEDDNLLDFNNVEWEMKLDLRTTYELVLESKTTFKELTQQQILPRKQQEEETPEIMMTPDNDLDLLLYKSKQPIPPK